MNNGMKKNKILSIVPARPGWVSKYAGDDGEVIEATVALWAIVTDHTGEQRVTGLSVCEADGLSPDDEVMNFLGWEMKDNTLTPPQNKAPHAHPPVSSESAPTAA